VQVLGQQQDFGSSVGPADAEVVELAAVAQGDGAGGADLVGADPVVGVGGPVAGDGLGPRGVGDRGGDPASCSSSGSDSLSVAVRNLTIDIQMAWAGTRDTSSVLRASTALDAIRCVPLAAYPLHPIACAGSIGDLSFFIVVISGLPLEGAPCDTGIDATWIREPAQLTSPRRGLDGTAFHRH